MADPARNTFRTITGLARRMPNLSNRRTGPRIFGVGAAKTGTHTLGEMFEDIVSSKHEADSERLIALFLAPGKEKALERFLITRDLYRGLKIDASQVNIFLLPQLTALFPESRYILTLRHPRAWLRSIVDDSLRREVSDTWMQFRDFRFQKGLPFSEYEAPLAAQNLYTVAGYLGYWRRAVDLVEEHVDPDKLLVVRTEDLSARISEIAAFCDLPPGQDPNRGTARFKNNTRSGVIEALDPAWLDAQIDAICGPAIAKYGLELAPTG